MTIMAGVGIDYREFYRVSIDIGHRCPDTCCLRYPFKIYFVGYSVEAKVST